MRETYEDIENRNYDQEEWDRRHGLPDPTPRKIHGKIYRLIDIKGTKVDAQKMAEAYRKNCFNATIMSGSSVTGRWWGIWVRKKKKCGGNDHVRNN